MFNRHRPQHEARNSRSHQARTVPQGAARLNAVIPTRSVRLGGFAPDLSASCCSAEFAFSVRDHPTAVKRLKPCTDVPPIHPRVQQGRGGIRGRVRLERQRSSRLFRMPASDRRQNGNGRRQCYALVVLRHPVIVPGGESVKRRHGVPASTYLFAEGNRRLAGRRRRARHPRHGGCSLETRFGRLQQRHAFQCRFIIKHMRPAR